MKILYISNFLDGTGYSVAASNYVRCMDSQGIDVVCRNIKLNIREVKPHPTVETLLNKQASGSNICIQHTLPCYFDADGRFDKNIGLFAYEASILPASWVKAINRMDECWVPCESGKWACYDSGVKVPVYVVPHTYDVNDYLSCLSTQGVVGKHKELTGHTVFYTIGEFVRRKDYAAIIKGFHTTFHKNEPVSLVIKTSKEGASPEQAHREVKEYIDKIKLGLKLYNSPADYKQEIIITERYSTEQLHELHREADIFVQTSHGEAWSQPAFDSLVFGKPAVLPCHTGYIDYAYDTNLLVESHEDICFGAVDSPPELYSAIASWYNIDILDLQKKLRRGYLNLADETSPERRQHRQESLKRFSYENIGRLIKQRLER